MRRRTETYQTRSRSRSVSLSRSRSRSHSRSVSLSRSRSRSLRRRRSARGPFKCLRNETSSRDVSFVDIRIKDGTAIIPDDEDIDDYDPKPIEPSPHESGVARIFLCPNDEHIDELEDYLEFGEAGVPDGTDPRHERGEWDASNDSENCPYDLRDLDQWIARRNLDVNRYPTGNEDNEESAGEAQDAWHLRPIDEYDAIFTFTELFFQNDIYGNLVQHKIYLFDHHADKITIVWRCCSTTLSWNNSSCQKEFVRDLLNGEQYFKPMRNVQLSCDSFLSLFLLECLLLDIDVLERAVQFEIGPKLRTDLMVITDAVPTNSFQAMEARIYRFNLMKCMVAKAEDIRETWAYLCQTLNLTDENKWPRGLRAQVRSETLRCASLIKHTKRLDTRYEDLFALNTTVSQSRQSFSVTILTVLAAVFLPLSLASSILSMQYRFNELGVRLYDFFGVAWLFCTFALACGALVRYGTYLSDRLWSLRHLQKEKYKTWKGSIKGIAYSYAAGWTFVLVSFLLGMFLKDQGVDWKAYPFLGAGIAIFALSPFVVPTLHILIGVLCVFAACFSLSRSFKREKRDKRRNMLGRRKSTIESSATEEV